MFSIDNIHDNINFKLRDLKLINDFLFCNTNEQELIKHKNILDNLADFYNIGITPELVNYYNNPNSDIAYNKVIKFIDNEDIINKIKHETEWYYKFYNKYKSKNIEKVVYMLEKLNGYYTEIKYIDIGHICDCGAKVTVENNIVLCKVCGISEVANMYAIESHEEIKKVGKYKPTKHAAEWLDRIQAIENLKYDNEGLEKCIRDVTECIINDGIFMENITCKLIRKYLKQTNNTMYNRYLVIIKHKITQKPVARFDHDEIKTIIKYFDLVVSIYNKQKGSKPNCPYHPYFIYKIIEQVINNPSSEDRKEEILSSIYLQNTGTVEKNDVYWKEICEKIPEFTFISTV